MNKRTFQELQDLKVNQYMAAWRYILDRWGDSTWQKIPREIQQILGLHSSLGMCSYTLVTEVGSKGMRHTIAMLNRDRHIQ